MKEYDKFEKGAANSNSNTAKLKQQLENPKAKIIFDVKCTRNLAPWIKEYKGEPIMSRTGHSFIKAKMKETGAALGGEMSGHIFFKERWYGFDDGTYAGCRLLEILSQHPDGNAVLNALPTSFSTPELNVPCAEGEPHRVTEALQAKAAAVFCGEAAAPGRPKQGTAPSGGSAAHAVASAGARAAYSFMRWRL